MHNLLNVSLLISAIVTCLAIGVATAYGLCNLLFAALRMRTVPKPVAVTKVADAARV